MFPKCYLIFATFIHNSYLNNIKILKLAYQLSCFIFFRKTWKDSHESSIFCIFVYFGKKQGGCLLTFVFIFRPTGNLLVAPLICYYFESVEYFSFFEHSSHLTEAEKNLYCFNLFSLFLSFEQNISVIKLL